MKKLLYTRQNQRGHWVGDGFPVRSIFSYNDLAQDMSPYLLMDYAGPYEFAPSTHTRGVGEHPHKGFETVTIVYSGEVEHRDSSGGGGMIGPGDVQWMTAASGIVHEEMHSRDFSEKGGTFEMVQLWVNLSRADKKAPAGYQSLKSEDIPRIELDDDAGSLRIIAGEYQGVRGPAKTFTPMNLWDLRVKAGKTITLDVPEGHTTSLFLLSGGLQLNDGKTLGDAGLAIFERVGARLSFTAISDSKLLFLGGEPIDEPIVGYGPFVMTSVGEIKEAMVEYQEGRMGLLAR